MELNSGLPSEYLFNALKHHLGSVSIFIQKTRNGSFSRERLKEQIKKIGRSMIDLYYGNLTPFEISSEIGLYLKSINCFDEKSYREYITASHKKYRTTNLSDSSRWILLLGKDAGKYIHIHPSRGSTHTVRVRAIALKTAIMLKIFYEKEISTSNLVNLVNKVRLEHLEEPPIKNELYTKGLQRILKLFQ